MTEPTATPTPARALPFVDRQPPPDAQLAYDAVVELSAAVSHGSTPAGSRFRVPIIGGRFEGPDIRGRIVPGGADWQLRRADGYLIIQADYFMETDDGVQIQVSNQGVIHTPTREEPFLYAVTTPSFEAPMGKHGWLNQFVFVGRLQPDSPEQTRAVYLSIYKLI